MTPATNPSEAELRLERILALIDDLDRLKGKPEARQAAIERMHKEVDAAKKPERENTH